MKPTRILSLILALLTVVSLLCACKPDDETDETVTVTNLNIIINGETDYVIVYDNNASQDIISAIQVLIESIKNNVGASITSRICFMDRQDETDVVTSKEILIGTTNREESTSVLSTMRSKDYTICAKNRKLIIGGGGEAGTLTAITRFINDFVVKQGNPYQVKQGKLQNLIFSSDKTLAETATYSYSTSHIMGVSLDQFAIIFPKNDTSSESLANGLYNHISAQTGYALPVLQDATSWADYEIRIGNAENNADHHNPNDGCICNTLSADEYYIKLVKTQVTYEDGSLHNGARLYICYGISAKDTVLAAFTEQIMPILAESKAFTLEEGFELTNRKA